MKKTVLVFGLLAGLIIAVLSITTMSLADNGMVEPSMLLGFATMALALSLIFPAVKNYRDKEQGGYIKFGTAFLMGILISLIASVLYAIGWEIYLKTTGLTASEVMNNMFADKVEELKKAGASAEEIAQYQVQDWYDLFIPRFLFTMFMEMFVPVGLTVSLICALILKKKPKAQTV